MTKKHFITLADTLRNINDRMERGAPSFGDTSDYMLGAREHQSRVVSSLADFCQSQNSQFNRQRWLDYIAGECGPNGGRK